MVYLIDPFQFIINNDTQIATRCNLINNFIFYTQQSFIIFIARESHIAGFLNINTQLISCQPIIQLMLFYISTKVDLANSTTRYKQVSIIRKQFNLFIWNSLVNVINIILKTTMVPVQILVELHR